ncbi:MAG: efflux RND transporter periplasmic adaptor subunit [Phycisphaerales bacterium]|nr:MAG: efflux RND transporter periplasmic adaptor subunit [Phycisphaerales bacterium]
MKRWQSILGPTVVSVLTRLIVSAAILAASIGIAIVLIETRQEPARTERDVIRPQVRVIETRPVEVHRQWDGFGTAFARHAANVAAEVPGVVIERPESIVTGRIVREGEVIVRLDPIDYEEEVAMTRQRIRELEAQLDLLDVELRTWLMRLELAQEDVRFAEQDYERVLDAQQRGAATQREVDQNRQILINASQNEIAARERVDSIRPRQSQLEATRAMQEVQLRMAEKNLERTTIRSPIDGIIQLVEVDRGDSVQMNQRVARIVDLRRIEVPLRVPSGARTFIGEGDRAQLLSEAGGRRQVWDAEITRIAPEDDETTRTMTVFVDLEQSPGDRDRLAPGKFVRGIVTSRERERRSVVPRRSVRQNQIRLIDEEGVVISRAISIDFRVLERFPELGVDDDQWVVLTDLLEEGALVVYDASRALSDGTQVEPVIIGRDNNRSEVAQNPEDGEPSP